MRDIYWIGVEAETRYGRSACSVPAATEPASALSADSHLSSAPSPPPGDVALGGFGNLKRCIHFINVESIEETALIAIWDSGVYRFQKRSRDGGGKCESSTNPWCGSY